MAMRKAFATDGKLDGRVADDGNANIAIARSLGRSVKAEGMVMAGFDDIYSIQYFKTNLRPYWNRRGDNSIEQQFALAVPTRCMTAKRAASS